MRKLLSLSLSDLANAFSKAYLESSATTNPSVDSATFNTLNTLRNHLYHAFIKANITAMLLSAKSKYLLKAHRFYTLPLYHNRR